MKDLVETVIAQVMRQDSAYVPGGSGSNPSRMPPPGRTVHRLNQTAQGAGKMPRDQDPLWQASRQFESMFVEQMLGSMRKTIPDSGLMKKGFADGVSTTMMDQAIADSIGKQGRMGIATSLYRQLSGTAPADGAATQAASIQVNGQSSDKQISLSSEKHQGESNGTH